MKKRLISLLVCVVLITALLPVSASADFGPKPETFIDFEGGFDGQTYYVTLLSDGSSYGPWNPDAEYDEYRGDKAVWDKFAGYDDPDGFMFLGNFQDCTETDRFSWTYYPPEVFKILVYFPDTDELLVLPEVYETYAFVSYFTVDTEDLSIAKTYEFGNELLSLFLRIVITIAVEIGVAWLFRFREKAQLMLIVKVNLFTQILLNVILNTVNFFSGMLAVFLLFFLGELIVFDTEAIIYGKKLPRENSEGKRLRPVLYAFVANLASLLSGFVILFYIPLMYHH